MKTTGIVGVVLMLAGMAQAKGIDGTARDDAHFTKALAAQKGERLKVELRAGGSAELAGWEGDRVVVEAELAAGCEATLADTATGVNLYSFHAEVDKSDACAASHFKIKVPDEYNIGLSTAHGDLALKEVKGTLTMQTGMGGLVLSRIEGRVALQTGMGDIRVSDANIPKGQAQAGMGDIVLERVDGKVQAQTGQGRVLRR